MNEDDLLITSNVHVIYAFHLGSGIKLNDGWYLVNCLRGKLPPPPPVFLLGLKLVLGLRGNFFGGSCPRTMMAIQQNLIIFYKYQLHYENRKKAWNWINTC